MFQSLSNTLQTSRFPAFARAAGLAAAIVVCPLALAAQPSVAEGPSAGASAQRVDGTAGKPEAQASANAAATSDFDARQKALDERGAQNDYAYGVAVHDCYSKFFVNACLGRARDKMRAVQARIQAEQLALNSERRAAHAQERDQREALKAAGDAADAPQRAAADARNAQAFEERQRQHALDEARRGAQAPERAANQAAYDRKQADYQRKLDDARRQAAQDARERAERAQRFEQKQEDAAQHKADVEARQKQAAQKAQEKQQEQLQQQEQQKQLQKEQQESD
jgi:hypothetical protein